MAGGFTNYVVLSSLAALWSVGVGGNLPVYSSVDSIRRSTETLKLIEPNGIFSFGVEFLPETH